jgi:hypothetical protein
VTGVQTCALPIFRGLGVAAISGGYDKGTVKDLPSLFSDVADHLICIHDNFRDLMSPFQKHAYYCRELGGSYSIKKVLPALCPNDKELDYNSLDLIHNGEEAKAAYEDYPEKSPDEQERIRAALLAYCRLDTLAMVKILGKLMQINN